MLLQNLYPKGQNSVIPRPLAAGIGILKVLPVYFNPKYALLVSVLGLSDTLGTVCTYYAYQIGRNAAQITPILAMITIISVLMGIVFLKERSNIQNKILGALVTAVGVLLVV
jgi:uncharacterized membrane protein